MTIDWREHPALAQAVSAEEEHVVIARLQGSAYMVTWRGTLTFTGTRDDCQQHAWRLRATIAAAAVDLVSQVQHTLLQPPPNVSKPTITRLP